MQIVLIFLTIAALSAMTKVLLSRKRVSMGFALLYLLLIAFLIMQFAQLAHQLIT